MNRGLIAFLCCLAAAIPCYAQADNEYIPLSAEDLDQLTARIALYPDAILAEVFVACTYPLDVVSASQWLKAGGQLSQIDSRDWDDSVKALARYPEVLNAMASDVDWMNQLGEAFLQQRDDVMDSVQALRAKASALGNLVSNDQQQVITEQSVIQIVPTDPQVIYVPTYNPQVVYVDQPVYVGSVYRPLVTFGAGVAVGIWLAHDCDWHDHVVYRGNWGPNRPWWHHDHGVVYANNRPGVSGPLSMRTGNRNTIIDNKPVRWERNDQKPGPKPRPLPSNPARRPGSGYDTPRPALAGGAANNPVLSNYGRGTAVSRESDRGKQSLGAAGVRPGVTRPGPATPPTVRPQPPSVTPTVRPTVTPSIPPPSARPSTPTRGGAIAGYQNRADTSSISQRGQASRGSISARGGGGRR